MIQERGYEGSLSNLQRLLAGWRRAEKQAKGPALEHQILEPVRDPETGHAISPVIAAALCTKPRGKLTPDQARKVDTLILHCADRMASHLHRDGPGPFRNQPYPSSTEPRLDVSAGS
jgi:hypothetical protein